MKKIHVDGGLFTTSGYSVASRGFVEALSKKAEVTIRDIPIQGDAPMIEDSPIRKLIANPPTDVDVVMMWGVPDLRKTIYDRFPIPEGAEKHHMLSWECDEIPNIWKKILNSDVDRVITPSNFSSQAFQGVTKRLHVVPHGYNPKEFYKKDDVKEDGIFRVLYAGTWIRRKAPMETIISLALGLIDTNSEILIKVNYDRNNLARIITSLQSQFIRIEGITAKRLPKIRIFNGIYTQEQMNDLYNIADVVVLTSRGEAWGLPLLNAMVTKTPIMTTNKGGQMDFVPEDYKYLIEVEGTEICQGDGYYSPQFGLSWHSVDFTLLQDKIKELFDMSAEERDKIGEELYDHIKDLTWDNVVDKYLSDIDQPLYNVKAKE